MKIKIFATGGTFDKNYNELNGELYFKDTHILDLLKLGRSRLDVDVETLMMMDSLDMQESDREYILDSVKKCKEEHVVITHGTDTMVKTAEVIASAGLEKTVVLAGAMIPYAFGTSDGLFNFGSALAFAQTLPFGVYVVMNGRYFDWDNCRKDKEKGEFVELK